MLVAVCSDIHDNIWKLEAMLQQVARADVLIFCGDFCAPFTLTQLCQGFHGPVHAVWGNNDGDTWLMTRNASTVGNVTLHGTMAELTLDGKKIAVSHYPHVARRLAESGAYHAVFYGHDHIQAQELVGGTLLLNPGEVMARFGHSTFALYDTESNQAIIKELQD